MLINYIPVFTQVARLDERNPLRQLAIQVDMAELPRGKSNMLTDTFKIVVMLLKCKQRQFTLYFI